MKILKGINASQGIVIGKVFLWNEEKLVVPKYNINRENITSELKRFHKAVLKSKQELDKLKIKTAGETKGTHKPKIELINSQILMLEDTYFLSQVEKTINDEMRNIEWIVAEVIEKMIEKLNASNDGYLMERSLDFHDISKRIISNLLLYEKASLINLKEEVVLVAHNLLPSDTISLNKQKVIGIATDVGGKTSHTAILARSFEIPAVLGLYHISHHVRNEDEIIIDGNQGLVIVNPDPETTSKYLKLKKKWEEYCVILQKQRNLPAKTLDGDLISLEANIEMPEEIETVIENKADGIGLFRSEFLFLQSDSHPQEEEQFEAYKYVLESISDKSVIIRTIDLGGDKVTGVFPDTVEANPILGWRAIRFCLSRPEIFKVQLRALYRASMFGNLKIMFPFVSSLEELELILQVVDEVKEELLKKKIPFKADVPLGIMIEIPSAAVTSDILAKRVDFFSIGTNDLIQYTIAVDRGNERVANLFDPFHPALLRFIQMIINSANENKIPVGMCGEMAGDPLATVVLLGMGLKHFSMSLSSIPQIKSIIRSISISDASKVVSEVMRMSSSKKIEQFLRDWMEKKFGYFTS